MHLHDGQGQNSDNEGMAFDKLIEEKLKKAHDEGQFDFLPKKGRLEFEDDSHIPEDERMAYHILKNNGFAPAWIEDDKTVRRKLHDARRLLARAWADYNRKRTQPDLVNDARTRRHIEWDWRTAREKFEVMVADINKDIFNFNLRAPAMALHRLPLRVAEEYQALGITDE